MNRRAEALNDMVLQIRQIHNWLLVREKKLNRLESICKSTEGLQQHRAAAILGHANDESINDHMHMLHRIEEELNHDLSELGTVPTVYIFLVINYDFILHRRGKIF